MQQGVLVKPYQVLKLVAIFYSCSNFMDYKDFTSSNYARDEFEENDKF